MAKTEKVTGASNRTSPKGATAKKRISEASVTPAPYHLTAAKYQSMHIKDLVVVKLARAIVERGFSQREAARYLGVAQPRISDLLRGNLQLFSLDTLVEWMFALDKPVTFSFDTQKDWGRSKPQAWSEEDLRDQIAYSSNVIKYNPQNSVAYNKRGSAYGDLQEYDLAIADYSKCVKLNPDRLGPLVNRAGAYKNAGQYQNALDDCNEMVRRFPQDGSGYYQRADIHAALKEYDKALADYAKMIELDPLRPGPYSNRARVYLQMNRPEEALADFEKAHEVDPTHESVRQEIARLKKQL